MDSEDDSRNMRGVQHTQKSSCGSADLAGQVKSCQPPVWMPLAVIIMLSGVFVFSDLDQSLQNHFWAPETGWFLKDYSIIQFLYHYGTWPALFVGGVSGVIWIASQVSGKGEQVRSLSLFLSLLLIIGPGLIVNAVFKDHFGRPRPVHIKEFGGRLSFQPLGHPGSAANGKSFPCGHASMGFYWLGVFIYFWHRRRGLAWAFGILGLVHGTIMGLGRMAQGGHWPSDVLWSAGFIYLTAWLLHYFIKRGIRPTAVRENLIE